MTVTIKYTPTWWSLSCRLVSLTESPVQPILVEGVGPVTRDGARDLRDALTMALAETAKCESCGLPRRHVTKIHTCDCGAALPDPVIL